MTLFYPIKKLYRGFASIRDYKVEEALQNKKNILVSFNGKLMTLPYEEIKKKKIQLNPRKFISKFTNKPYTLYDFRWVEDK